MNKKTLRITGWALGLSIAVAGVGIAVGASAKAPIEAKADAPTETITLSQSTFSGMGNNNYGSGVEYTGTVQSSSSETSINVGGHYITNNSGWQWQANNANVYNITELPGRITNITVTQTGTARAFTAYAGNEQLFSSSETGTSKSPSGDSLGAKTAATMSWDIDDSKDYTFFAIHKGANAGKVTSVVVTFESSDPSISADPSSATIYTTGTTSTTIDLEYTNFPESISEVVATSDNTTVIPDANCVFNNDYSKLTITSNGVAGSATINVLATDSGDNMAELDIAIAVVDNSKVLDSIDVTTAPTKTTYVEGDTLDLTGLVVTATYTDKTTSDVTALCSFSPANGATLTTSDTSIAISYTLSDVTKNTSQAITVNEYPYQVASSINGGDTIVIANASKANYLSSINTSGKTPYGNQTAYTGNVPSANTYSVVAGSEDGTFAFLGSDSKYLSWSSDNSLTTASTISANSSWTVEIAENVATVTNVSDTTRVLKYNSSATRFACYTSGQALLTIYKLNGSDSAAATTFSAGFMSDIGTSVCDYDGATSTGDLSTAWSAKATSYAALSSGSKAYIASFTANEDGNDVEKMISLYNYIYNKYGKSLSLTNWLGRSEAVKKAAAIIPSIGYGDGLGQNSGSLFITLSIIGMMGAAGGFVFLARHRKEDR